MKRSVLLVPLLFLLAGCGRHYTLIGKVLVIDSISRSSITEIVGSAFPEIGGTRVPGASISIFHELKDNLPVRESVWNQSVKTDENGHFEISSYAAPVEEALVGLEVTAPGYETVFTTYMDYSEPDEQFFVVVLRKAG